MGQPTNEVKTIARTIKRTGKPDNLTLLAAKMRRQQMIAKNPYFAVNPATGDTARFENANDASSFLKSLKELRNPFYPGTSDETKAITRYSTRSPQDLSIPNYPQSPMFKADSMTFVNQMKKLRTGGTKDSEKERALSRIGPYRGSPVAVGDSLTAGLKKPLPTPTQDNLYAQHAFTNRLYTLWDKQSKRGLLPAEQTEMESKVKSLMSLKAQGKTTPEEDQLLLDMGKMQKLATDTTKDPSDTTGTRVIPLLQPSQQKAAAGRAQSKRRDYQYLELSKRKNLERQRNGEKEMLTPRKIQDTWENAKQGIHQFLAASPIRDPAMKKRELFKYLESEYGLSEEDVRELHAIDKGDEPEQVNLPQTMQE
jgi:hypothetical protein